MTAALHCANYTTLRMSTFFDLTPGQQSCFPRHGWMSNESGRRHLRLPVLRLYQQGEPTHARIVERNAGGMYLQSRSPFRTLRQLAIALRDLHKESTVIASLYRAEWASREPSSGRDDALTRVSEGQQSIEILLIAIFVLLRRLADELIDASVPFLFDSVASAPRAMKAAVRMARDGALEKAKPICNLDVLRDALLNRTQWWAQLRDQGIRDTLVHQPHILQVNGQGSRAPEDSETSWCVSASLVTIKSGEPHVVDLIPALVDCIAGACRFMDLLYTCAAPLNGYGKCDALILIGADKDVVGFWPPILDAESN